MLFSCIARRKKSIYFLGVLRANRHVHPLSIDVLSIIVFDDAYGHGLQSLLPALSFLHEKRVTINDWWHDSCNGSGSAGVAIVGDWIDLEIATYKLLIFYLQIHINITTTQL